MATTITDLTKWAVGSRWRLADEFPNYDAENTDLLVVAAITWPDGATGSYFVLTANGLLDRAEGWSLTHDGLRKVIHIDNGVLVDDGGNWDTWPDLTIDDF